ncbi:Os03g0771301 [Oryza sativa Japonica Group]|uniref:Os03g0771301 protein n=1 Tax=Oryza sativa subsp. japonica TaxID=39947 RepID=A0A0P0W3I5_ORYSJ|nr:Os03g0771301 [Oryza sativa Japonica Group]
MPELVAEAASSTVHIPTSSSSVRIGAVTGGSDEQAMTATMKLSSAAVTHAEKTWLKEIVQEEAIPSHALGTVYPVV